MTDQNDRIGLKLLPDSPLHGPVGLVANTAAELVEEEGPPLCRACLPMAVPKTASPYPVPQQPTSETEQLLLPLGQYVNSHPGRKAAMLHYQVPQWYRAQDSPPVLLA